MRSEKRNLIIVFPGMLAPRSHVEPLVRYLQDNVDDAYVLSIGLKLSLGSFDSLVSKAVDQISPCVRENKIEKIILIGHSHGGRVAVAVRNKLKELFSYTFFDVILLGTPVLRKPRNIPWYRNVLYKLSGAFRSWPVVTQPKEGKYICLYSKDDGIVDEASIRDGFMGDTIQLEGLRHSNLIDPKKIGPVLIKLLSR